MSILSTQASSKQTLAVAALTCAGAILALIISSLFALAVWTETNTDTYPFRTEDWLRYLLPTLFEDRGDDRILIVGPSEAREDLLYETFDKELPGTRAFQGALSLGTLDDVLLGLNYIEKAYGRGAIPRAIIVGITPRFVGNIPENVSPFARAVDSYSPHYRVARSPEGSRLVPKTFLEGLLSRYRFLQKYNLRYRSGIAYLMQSVLHTEFRQDRGEQNLIAYALRFWIFHHTSPYKYRNLMPYSLDELEAWLNDPASFWFKAHEWDPRNDESRIQAQLERLIAIANRWGSKLYIVNLPEHPLNRGGYKEGYYEAYLDIVRASIGATPFLNLRTLLDSTEFFDLGHATHSGALRVSSRVADFVRRQGGITR